MAHSFKGSERTWVIDRKFYEQGRSEKMIQDDEIYEGKRL